MLSTWHQEQEGELATLRAHCQGRHKQLDDILHNLNRYMEEVLIIAILILLLFRLIHDFVFSLHEEHNHLKGLAAAEESKCQNKEKTEANTRGFS